MMRLVEDGEMYRLRRFWDARKPECIQSAKRNVMHVGIKEFSCALAVFAIGILLSFFVLLFEIASQKKFRLKSIFKAINKQKKVKLHRKVKGVIVPYVN